MPAPSFKRLPPSKPDPIFLVAMAAKAAGPTAINGTIGVYMDEDGKTVIFPSVQKAIADIAAELHTRSYAYSALLGLPGFRSRISHLIFGDTPTVNASIACTGGTEAIALNLRLVKLMDPDITLILPTPAWANHPPLCHSAGLRIIEVPYLSDGQPTIEGITDALKRERGSCVVLVQVGCHNPTGLDLESKQWNELQKVCAEREAIALLDLAYQGFRSSPEEDACIVREFAQSTVTTLVAWSASKNHSLYSERVGLACTVVPDEQTQITVEAHYSTLTRGIHSAAATIGQSIVARVQEAYHDQWLQDMAGARKILQQKRTALRKYLPDEFHAALDGHGIFAVLPLSVDQIQILQRDHHVFLTEDGRINIAGIALDRMEELAEAIRQVRTPHD